MTTPTPGAHGSPSGATGLEASPGPRPRRGIARILYAPADRFRTIVFDPGQSRSFGRDDRADVQLRDPELRGAHFELLFDGECFHAWLLSGSTGLAIDGLPAPFGEVASGGFLVAGRTTFGLHVEGAASSAPPAPRSDEALRALAPSRAAGRLYGVLDQARSPRVGALLAASVDEQASLYDGAPAAALDDVAPYLVRFDPSSRLLERVLHAGWGDAFGVFLASGEPFRQVRRHLRRFLMIEEVPSRERYYFRFYDPRALREFWPIATPRQRGEILGHVERDAREGSVVDSLYWEAEDGGVDRADAVPDAHVDRPAPEGRAHVPHP